MSDVILIPNHFCQLRWEGRCPWRGFSCTNRAAFSTVARKCSPFSWAGVISRPLTWFAATKRGAKFGEVGGSSRCCPTFSWRRTNRQTRPSGRKRPAAESWATPTARVGCFAAAYRSRGTGSSSGMCAKWPKVLSFRFWFDAPRRW